MTARLQHLLVVKQWDCSSAESTAAAFISSNTSESEKVPSRRGAASIGAEHRLP
jgi:hypothetical protein